MTALFAIPSALATPIEDYLHATRNLPDFPPLPPVTAPQADIDRHATAVEKRLRAGDVVGAIAELEQTAALLPDDATLQVELGELYLRAGLAEQARDAAERAMALSPDAAQPYDIVGTAQRLLGHPQAAVDAYTKASERAPGSPVPRLHLAATEIARMNYAAALAAADEVLRLTPRSAAASVIAADSLLHLGKLDEALAGSEQAIAADRDNGYAYMLRGDALSALHRLDAAEAAYRQAVTLMPDFIPFAARLAECLATQGHEQEALGVYLDILKRHGGDLPTHAALAALYEKLGQPAQVALHRAIVAQARGDSDGAARLYEAATNADKTLKDAWLGRAALAKQAGRLTDAAGFVAHALALAPDDTAALTLQGELASARGDAQGAAASYVAALKANERYAPALMALAGLARGRSDCRAALQLYSAASAAEPNSAAPHEAMGHCHETLGELADAAHEFRVAVSLSPTDANAVNSLAWVELMQGDDLPGALLLAKRASLLAPGDAAIIDTLGWAYLRNGRPDLAAANLQTALAGLPDQPTVQYHLGMALAALGQRDAAIAALRAAERNPFPEAVDARRELERLQQGSR